MASSSRPHLFAWAANMFGYCIPLGVLQLTLSVSSIILFFRRTTAVRPISIQPTNFGTSWSPSSAVISLRCLSQSIILHYTFHFFVWPKYYDQSSLYFLFIISMVWLFHLARMMKKASVKIAQKLLYGTLSWTSMNQITVSISPESGSFVDPAV